MNEAVVKVLRKVGGAVLPQLDPLGNDIFLNGVGLRAVEDISGVRLQDVLETLRPLLLD